MASKTYSVRVPTGAPDVSSEQAGAWLDAQSASGIPLVADPGAGERTLRLSLDQEKVKAGAKVAQEPEAVFLRRLVASYVRIPEESVKAEPEAKPKPPPVLKGAMRLQPEQVKPIVRLFEAGQSFVIRRALNAPEALQAAAFTEEEREQLAVSATEVVNRRAPARMIENADLIGLATTVVAIEARKIEAVQAVAERYQRASQQRSTQQQLSQQQQQSPEEL